MWWTEGRQRRAGRCGGRGTRSRRRERSSLVLIKQVKGEQVSYAERGVQRRASSGTEEKLSQR